MFNKVPTTIIVKVMGKLKFTFANLWYWVALILVCTLTENLMHMTSAPKSGFDFGGLLAISLACIGCLFMFFFVSHKSNKIKFDWVLFPAIIILGGCFMLSIWLNNGMVVPYKDNSSEIVVTISTFEKIRASIILVIFLALTYAMLFVSRANGFRNKVVNFVALVGIVAALISLVYSLIVEKSQYAAIFKDDDLKHIVIDSFYGNKNYYGGVLFIGFLSCIIANYYKPRFYKYMLMVIFMVATLASAAMLPSVISVVALALYLFEEILRFSIKKRWICSIFALFALLSAVALVVVFYYGVTHTWKGFNGLDTYLSETFKNKDFLTFTGRTTIWRNVFPYCFKDPFHLVFGYGFMISEKNILAITGAMYNNPATGVRTTHNGYLQMIFEYGLIGSVVHVVLIGFFIYSCIRMMIEKKFHFAFTYMFVGLCAATYNFCESSSYFDAGTKEVFMTQLFVVPVLTEAKMLGKNKKLEELRSIDENREPMKPNVMGKGLSLIIVSALITVGMTFLSPLTYEIVWLKNLMINLAIYLGIALLFIPYLASLYYRKTDKPYFVANCVINGLLISLVMFALFMFMNHNAETRRIMPYALPAVLFVILLLETIIYSLIKGATFKDYASVTFGGSIIMARNALVGATFVGGIAFISFSMFNMMTLFNYFMIMILTMMGFYGVYYFLPTKDGKEVRGAYDELHLNTIKREFVYNEKYYG